MILRFFFFMFVSLLSLYAIDDPECSDSSMYQDSIVTGYKTTFKKHCLPDEFGNLKQILNIRGGIYQIGNHVLCAMDNTVSTSECIDPNSKLKADNSCADENDKDGCQNNDFFSGPDTAYIGAADYDDNSSNGVSAVEAAKTTNSSMAKLTLKTGDDILWARLFWMGRTASGDNDFADVKTVKLLTPDTNNSYIDINCTSYAKGNLEYVCATDITDYVTQSGNYWVGDVKGRALSSNQFSAWNIVIVYKNNADPFQNISIYEGFNTFFNSSLQVEISGFLTPEIGDVKASFHIFAGESDNGYYDRITVSNSQGAVRLYNPTNSGNTDYLNASISQFGINNVNRLPNFVNAMGIDVDSNYIVSDANNTPILENNQTSTQLVFTSVDDQLYVPIVAFSTELYQPKLCYDYAYEQNGRTFTEENYDGVAPRLSGDVIPNQPVTVSIFIKNLNEGTQLSNIVYNLSDLNTSQAVYDQNLSQTYPGELYYFPVDSTHIYASSDSGVNFLLADTIANNQGMFIQFEVMPSVELLDMPLNMALDFDIEFESKDPVPYTNFQLNQEIPLCSGGGAYTPPKGIFSILDRDLNVNSSTGALNPSLKYNLFTQVTNRPINAEIVAFDPQNLDVVTATNSYVAVELINAGKYHDVNTSCLDPNTRISAQEWVRFQGPDGNTSHMQFIPQDSSFYSVARENASFRIWYFIGDDQENSIFEYNEDGEANLVNFAGTHGSCQPPTGSSVSKNATISSMCGNASATNGMTLEEQQLCAECVFGLTARPICSRDNFSIRPEAFDIRIFDIDHAQTLGSTARANTKQPFTASTLTLAAGYPYRFEINATTHTDSTASSGYTQSFLKIEPDRNVTFVWNPVSGFDDSGCNDTNTSTPAFYLLNGKIFDPKYFQERKLSNVGRYKLAMIDSKWTTVDQNASHHTGSYFQSGSDCLQNSDIVPAMGTTLNQSNVGCNIQSAHTNAYNASLSTSDYTLTFVPHDFNLTGLIPNHGINSTSIAQGANATLYMHDLNTSTDMGYRFTGRIRAVGEDEISLSNFVSNCYAQPIDLTIGHNAPIAQPNVPLFTYRQIESNTTAVINDTFALALPSGTSLQTTIPASRFSKDLAGEIDLNLTFNFDRNRTRAVNPQNVLFSDFNVSCTTPSACQSSSELVHTTVAEQNLTASNQITFLYGRLHAPRYRVEGAQANINLYYEAFCSQDINCTNGTLGYTLGAESVDDVNWYVNPMHTSETVYGNIVSLAGQTHASATTFSDFSSNVNYDLAGEKTNQITYDGSLNYPFKSKIIINTQPWLVYHRFDQNATTNALMVEFYNSNAGWSGTSQTSSTVDNKASKTTNRRINW